jgi:hypothetical protein
VTERLSQLLHEEAQHLDVPAPPDAGRVALDGRRLRRRRRLVRSLVAAAAVAVVATGSLGVSRLLPDGGRVGPTTGVAADAVVYGWQDTVVIGDRTVELPGTVRTLDLAAPGVLVTTRNPDAFWLVRPDGSTVDLGPASQGSAVATDPESEVFVEKFEPDGSTAVVVRDLETGEVRRVVSEADRVGGIALDGGTAYLSIGPRAVLAVDVADGDTRRIAGSSSSGLPAVRGGRRLLWRPDSLVVQGLADGEGLLTVEGGVSEAALSHDGRWLVTVDRTRPDTELPDEGAPSETTVHDVFTGESVVLEAPGVGWSWTPAGTLYRVEGDEVVRCEPATGGCERDPAPEPLPGYGNAALPGMPFV